MLIIHRTKFILSVTALVLGVATLTGCACEASDPPVKMADSLTAPAGSIPATTSGQSVTTSEQETGGSSESDPIVYSDPVFQKLLETELGKTAITPTDLDPYTRIVIGGDHFISLSGVDLPEKKLVLLFGTDVELDGVRYTGFGTMKTLDDLKHFKNIDQLKVTLQPDLDYSTIPEDLLPKLSVVHVSQSKLNDIGFLRGAVSLISLSLPFGEVEDLAPISDLNNLYYLSGSGNPIRDLAPLAGLSKLKSVSLTGSAIRDLKPLSGLTDLKTLEFYNNQIEDLTPLSGLSKLERLELVSNQVRDVSPLNELKNLKELLLNGNPAENIEEVEHIEGVVFEP